VHTKSRPLPPVRGEVSVQADTTGKVTDDEILQRIRQATAAEELPPPAPPEAVAELEAAVGLPMPPLLKRAYLEVADGGFGRWGEALSLTDTTYRFSNSGPLLEEYVGWRALPHHPAHVVPLLAWGCGIWSFVDYRTPQGRLWAFDPHTPGTQHTLFPEDLILAHRLVGWLHDDEDFPEAPPRGDRPHC
jgi:hypothetical protein